MKVLYLGHSFADVTTGGLAEVLHYLPLSSKPLGVESLIYTQNKEKDSKRKINKVMLSNQVPHYSGPFLKPRFYTSRQELNPVVDLCISEKVDLIHAQGTYRSGYLAMHLHHRTGIPYIVTSHSDISTINSERMKRKKIIKRCQQILNAAAFVTHLTPFMETYSHNLLDTHNKSRVIHNGINTADWQLATDIPEQDYLFAIGRLVPEKGFGVLIDAFARLYQEGVRTSLVIAGSGSDENNLQLQAKNTGIPVITQLEDFTKIPSGSIIFTGKVKGEQKKLLFWQSKGILFPTQPAAFEEAFGIVQLEAMAAGKPLIASDINASRYLKQLGMEAELVSPTDTYTWCDRIKYLLINDNQRKMMGSKNLIAIKQLDWTIIAAQYEAVYKDIVSANRHC